MRRGILHAQPVEGDAGAYIVTLECGHEKATRAKASDYDCLTCGPAEPAIDVAPVSVSFEVDSLAETYCYGTLRVQVRLPLDSVQAQALDCDAVARAVADALRCHPACPECRGVGRDHKLRCSRREGAGLVLPADRSER